MKVSEVMSSDLITVRPDTRLKEAARLMIDASVSGLPVVDDDGRLVGIVTEADFVDQEAQHSWGQRRSLLDPLFGRGDRALADADFVGDVMTGKVATIGVDDSLSAAARDMVKRKVKRLPVVDADGRLVGIVSRSDVLKAFVREDYEIEAEVRALLEGRVLPIDPGLVAIIVEDGVVTLSGEVDARADARVLVDYVDHVDGVVRVDNRLSWHVDDRRAEGRWVAYPQEPPG